MRSLIEQFLEQSVWLGELLLANALIAIGSDETLEMLLSVIGCFLVSNALLLAMLFLVGFWWVCEARTIPWLTGLVVLMIGLFMVGVAQLFSG
ncbi:MAG TPA: hypothetical protein PLN21_10125 [Gemmatales bacterium]|nr:hypothetical protein [Gemmatales bacterium]